MEMVSGFFFNVNSILALNPIHCIFIVLMHIYTSMYIESFYECILLTGIVDILDVVNLVNIILGDSATECQMSIYDFDDSSVLDILDTVFLVNSVLG